MQNEDEMMPRFPSELVMCSTCSGFVMRKERRTSIIPDPDGEVVEVLTKAEKMRDLIPAFLLHGPLQEKEPAEATKEQWQVLQRRRMIAMETNRCPACSRLLVDMCPTCSRALSEKPGPGEEDKAAAGSKEKKRSSRSREEGSELMDVLPSQGGKEREEGRRSCSGLEKKKAKSEDKEGGGSKTKRSREPEGSGLKEAEMEGSGLKEVKMEVSESAGRNGKTKMVTSRLDKMSIDFILKYQRPLKPFTCTTNNPFLECMFASEIARYEVDCEFQEYLRRQYIIRGYADYQREVTEDEDE